MTFGLVVCCDYILKGGHRSMVKKTVYRNSSRVTAEFGDQQYTISLYHLILPHVESSKSRYESMNDLDFRPSSNR